MYSIGDLSRRTGVKIPTIRYYEQMGLISAADRTEGNQRRYGADGLERLSFIRHSRDLGLSISAIRDMIRLSQHPDRPCDDADRIVGEHLAAVRAKIARLRRLEKELAHIASACDGGEIGDCDVIRALADHSLCETGH